MIFFFPIKAGSVYLPLHRFLVTSTTLAFMARHKNKWSIQIKSVMALSIFQAGHAFLFIQRMKTGRFLSQLSLFI